MAIAFRGLALVVIGLIVESAWGQTSPSVADILQMVRAGGYVIVFRHGATYPDRRYRPAARRQHREAAPAE